MKPSTKCKLFGHENLGVYARPGDLQLDVGKPYYDGVGRAHREVSYKCQRCGAKVRVGKTIDPELSGKEKHA